jgi:hypothetical protein
MQMSLILIMLPPLNEYLTGALARLRISLLNAFNEFLNLFNQRGNVGR